MEKVTTVVLSSTPLVYIFICSSVHFVFETSNISSTGLRSSKEGRSSSSSPGIFSRSFSSRTISLDDESGMKNRRREIIFRRRTVLCCGHWSAFYGKLVSTGLLRRPEPFFTFLFVRPNGDDLSTSKNSHFYLIRALHLTNYHLVMIMITETFEPSHQFN